VNIIIGFVIVIVCVIGGYLFANGTLSVLLQPAELIIIGGAAAGALIIGTPSHVMKKIVSSIKAGVSGKGSGPTGYMDLLRVLFELATLSRSNGILAMEKHVENPGESDILGKIGHRHELVEFLCDSLRLVVLGISPVELSGMLDSDLEVREEESQEPADSLANTADALPGLGIVAAVLGIIITMNSIGGDSASVGKHVAAALVGTFLGVLLSYGFVGPLARVVRAEGMKDLVLMKVARTGILSLSTGINPMMVCESARRSIPEALRPGFKVMEDTLRNRGK
jgi:chemotaxis protein MotA